MLNNEWRFAYSQDVVAPRIESLPWRYNCRLWINEELPILIAVHNAVGEVAVGPVITVIGKHPIDGLALLPPLSLWKFYLVDLLRKCGLVVIFIQDLNHHPHCTLPGTRTTIRHQHLRGQYRMKESIQNTYTQNLFQFRDWILRRHNPCRCVHKGSGWTCYSSPNISWICKLRISWKYYYLINFKQTNNVQVKYYSQWAKKAVMAGRVSSYGRLQPVESPTMIFAKAFKHGHSGQAETLFDKFHKLVCSTAL